MFFKTKLITFFRDEEELETFRIKHFGIKILKAAVLIELHVE